MKAMLRNVNDRGNHYTALAFVCPGCMGHGGSGLHLLPVNTDVKSPSWSWDGNLRAPTLTPSILTKYEYGVDKEVFVCHSFLRGGVFEFLSDCTHDLVGKHIDLPDLPEWFVNEAKE